MKVMVTMRVEKKQVEEIDTIAKYLYTSRTAFILQAVTFYRNYLRRRGELK